MSKIEIGFQDIGNKNGVRWFVTNDAEGIKASYLTEEKNLHTGKMYTKRHELDYQTGVNNKTGEEIRMYHLEMDCGDIEIKANGETEIIKNSYDKKKWGL